MLLCFYKYKNCKMGENKMQDLIKDIEDGFCNQDIYLLIGNKDDEQIHFVRYFETNNRIMYMDKLDDDGLPTYEYYRNFEFALNKFLNLCNEVKIIIVMGDEIPLYNFIKNIDLGRKQYA